MRTVIFILTFIMFTAPLAGARVTMSRSVKKYHRLINAAELSICKDEKDKACRYYERAYKIVGNKMSNQTIFNFLLVTIYENKDDATARLLTELKKRSWDLPAIMRVIAPIDSATSKKLQCAYSQIKVAPELDSEYIRKIDSMVDIDQRSNKYLRSLHSGILDSTSMDSTARLTSNNLNCLYNLFSQRFPTGKTMGNSGHGSSGNRQDVILIHNWQGRDLHLLDTIYYHAYMSGKIDVSDFEFYLEKSLMVDRKDPVMKIGETAIDTRIYPYDFIVLHDSLFEFAKNDSFINAHRKNRGKIPGFDRPEEQREKIIFQYYNPGYRFVNGAYFPALDFEFLRGRVSYVGRENGNNIGRAQ